MLAKDHTYTQEYLQQRLQELGLSLDNAKKYNLSADADGNILQGIRNFQGEQITYFPQTKIIRKKLQRIKDRKSGVVEGLDSFSENLNIIRYSPANLEKLRVKKPDTGKYKLPSKRYTGFGAITMPTPLAINSLNNQIKGGTTFAIEGYFKAVALDTTGVEALAFSGITTYKIDEALEEYLITRQLDNFVINYDGDALETREVNGIISSKRVEDFCNSATRFAIQFYNFKKKHNLKTQLHFCMVNVDQAAKGVDDLLGEATDKDAVIQALNSLEDSKYFSFLKLGTKKDDKKLLDFFGLTNHEQFYNRNKKAIGKADFIYRRCIYQIQETADELFNQGSNWFQSKFDPYKVDLKTTTINIEEWLTEATTELEKAIEGNDRLMIESPTGSGKTAFFLGYKKGGRFRPGYFLRNRVKGVIVVPYIIQAMQLEREFRNHGAVGFYGSVSNRKKEEGVNASIIICTYDNLRHVTDLASRIKVVDEAHHLVNSYGEIRAGIKFRASTINNIADSFDTAKKTILISATPPRLLAKMFDFKHIAVNRKINNIIKVHSLQSEVQSAKSLTAKLLDELIRTDFNEDKVHIVYFNSKKQLARIKAHLLRHTDLTEQDIEVITRDEVDNGNNRIFNQIVKSSKISGVKLILTTCLLAEGININNTNIGSIYCVGIKCVDSFRQFGARFRKMDEVSVYDIKYPEQQIKDQFLSNAVEKMEYLLDIAATQKKYAVKLNNNFLTDYTDNDLSYWDDIKPNYEYDYRELKWLYDKDGIPEIDNLKILAAIRETKLKYANNAYFYTELSKYSNIIILGDQVVSEEEKEVQEIRQAIIRDEQEEVAQILKTEKELVLEQLKEDLLSIPSIVVQAYLIHAQNTKNRHALGKIHLRCPKLIVEKERAVSLSWLDEYKEHFKLDYFVKLINAYIKLHSIQASQETIEHEITNYNKSAFNRKWKQLEQDMEFAIYEDANNTRKLLSAAHKTDIKIKKGIVELIRKYIAIISMLKLYTPNLTVTTSDLLQMITKFLTVRVKGKEATLLVKTQGQLETILNTSFNVQEVKYAGYKEYIITDRDIPFGLEQLPSKSKFAKSYLCKNWLNQRSPVLHPSKTVNSYKSTG